MQGHSGNADQFQETIRDIVTRCLLELLPPEQLNNAKMTRTATDSCLNKPLTDLSFLVEPLYACSHGGEQSRLTERVCQLPQVCAAVRPVAHTFCCRPIQPLVQCHEVKRTSPNSQEQEANLTTDNTSSGPSISSGSTTDLSSEGSSLTSNSSTICDSHSVQERASQVAQQEANGGHRLRSWEEFRLCSVHLQPTRSPAAVLTPHSTQVTLRSPLLLRRAPPALIFSSSIM